MLSQRRAHTAIVDCEILRDFVKKFALSDPEIFQALKKTSHKSHVLDLLHGSNEWFMHTAWYAGKEYVYPLSFCGMVENNANDNTNDHGWPNNLFTQLL